MARREIADEKKSYSAVFLLAAGLLLISGVWSIWDDYIARRPWKKYQAQFYQLAYNGAWQELTEEEKRLQDDSEYQEAVKKLSEAQAELQSDKTSKHLQDLESASAAARVRASDLENSLRLVKSELDVAWYEYEHALQTGHSVMEERKIVDELEEERVATDKEFQAAEAERDRIENEMAEIRLGVKEWTDQVAELSKPKERIRQRMKSYVLFSFDGFAVPKIPKIDQVVLPEFDHGNFGTPLLRVDRCQSCHIGIARGGFEDEPHPFRTHPDREAIFTPHPPEKFGCTPCHEGQGPAVNSLEQAHGEVQFWEHPLRRGAKVEANCIKCHSNVQNIAHAQTIAGAENLFIQIGCPGCHLVEGYGHLPKIGPELRRVAAKADPSWMVRWVKNPQDFRPRTRMPHFLFQEEEAIAVVAYLLDASKKEAEEWLSSHPAPWGINPSSPALVEQGKALVNSLGCRGCHGFAEGETATVTGQNKDFAPNLANIAEKVDSRWLYHWISNPKDYSATTVMPSLRLTTHEARAITSYLMTLGEKKSFTSLRQGSGQATSSGQAVDFTEKLSQPETIARGKALVRKYGCFGCHEIPGMENEARIGVELSTFNSKPFEEFFFGNRTDIPETWDDWTYHKLKSPRIYETERIEQLMPQFDLAEEDIISLRVFLASRTDHKIPSQYLADRSIQAHSIVEGHRLVRRYNCIGCHEIEGQGGYIRAHYTENPAFAPPVLNGEGAKVQPDWLFGFVKKPITLRPWLQVRMPTFSLSNEEVRTVVDYFAAVDDIEMPFVYFDPEAIPQGHVQAAEMLMSDDYFSCFSCHQQGEKKPEGPPDGWAPDLALAKHRLNPNWIIDWILDPQKVQPGTRMPAFYPGGPEDIFAGDEEKQIEAMRDYLMVLGEEGQQLAGRTIAGGIAN